MSWLQDPWLLSELHFLYAGSYTQREGDGLLLNYTGTQNQSGPSVCCYGNAGLNTFLVAGWYQTVLVLSPCPLYPADGEREWGTEWERRERLCACMSMCVLTLGFQSKSLLTEAASLPQFACHEGNICFHLLCVWVWMETGAWDGA